MEERIEDFMFPENNTIKAMKNGTLCSMIVDAEIDPIFLQFHNDGCIYVDCKDLHHIYLTPDNLREMRKLLYKAEKMYNKQER